MKKKKKKKKKKKRSILSLLPPPFLFPAYTHEEHAAENFIHAKKKSGPVNQYIVDVAFLPGKKKRTSPGKQRKSRLVFRYSLSCLQKGKKKKYPTAKTFLFLRSNAKKKEEGGLKNGEYQKIMNASRLHAAS